MGKAEIVDNKGLGLYSVKLIFHEDDAEARKTLLISQIAKITATLSTMPAGTNKDILIGKLASMRAELEKLNFDTISDETRDAWCADYTLDLSGIVGTIEVSNEKQYVNIYPGDREPEFDADRDGQLQPKQNSIFPHATYYNMAVQPGWQKWMPKYRYATITAIDHDLDTCSIDLLDIRSTQHGELDETNSDNPYIDVNYKKGFTDVPIDYMTCDSQPFSVSDVVVVRFDEVSKNTPEQNWDHPVVIGFRDNPKPCGYRYYLKCTFNGHSPSKGGEIIKVDSTPYGWAASSVCDENGICGPFTTNPALMYAYLYFYQDFDYTDEHGFSAQALYRHNRELTPVEEAYSDAHPETDGMRYINRFETVNEESGTYHTYWGYWITPYKALSIFCRLATVLWQQSNALISSGPVDEHEGLPVYGVNFTCKMLKTKFTRAVDVTTCACTLSEVDPPYESEFWGQTPKSIAPSGDSGGAECGEESSWSYSIVSGNVSSVLSFDREQLVIINDDNHVPHYNNDGPPVLKNWGFQAAQTVATHPEPPEDPETICDSFEGGLICDFQVEIDNTPAEYF